MRARVLASWVVAVLVGSVAPAAAVPMQFTLQGVDDSTLTAEVLFAYDATLGQIDIDITNTSGPPGVDPRLTAFAFNVPAEVTGIDGFTGPANWTGFYDANDIDTPGQFGFYDMAGLTGPNFNGGSPNDGIPRDNGVPPSETRHFTFVLTGLGLGSLDETSFLSLVSFDPPGGSTHDTQYFIARFQRTGADGEGSDVAIPTGDPTPTGDPIPEPGTLLLLGSGLTALWRGRRKRA